MLKGAHGWMSVLCRIAFHVFPVVVYHPKKQAPNLRMVAIFGKSALSCWLFRFLRGCVAGDLVRPRRRWLTLRLLTAGRARITHCPAAMVTLRLRAVRPPWASGSLVPSLQRWVTYRLLTACRAQATRCPATSVTFGLYTRQEPTESGIVVLCLRR